MTQTKGERALSRLLHDAHLASADRMPAVVGDAAAEIGARDAAVLVVDHAQTQLIDMAGDAVFALDGSVAGQAYRLGHVEEEDGRLWVPLLDGIERVGVLGLTLETVDAQAVDDARRIASLLAEILLSKRLYSDTLHRAARRREMDLAAEIQWGLLPPVTAGTDRVTVSGMLEPAYEVGGDVFDYSLEHDLVQLAIFDAMGHGLGASLCSSLAVGAYRNTRRAGEGPAESARAIEHALRDQFKGERFTTAILAELDTGSGALRWLNAGHPPPLLLRGGTVVKELTGAATPPLGLGLTLRPELNEETLEPGDRVLLYTDGVVENRPGGGDDEFGVERLAEFLVHADAAGEELPETMRRLSQTLMERQGGPLRDDASQVLLEWRGGTASAVRARFSGEALA